MEMRDERSETEKRRVRKKLKMRRAPRADYL